MYSSLALSIFTLLRHCCYQPSTELFSSPRLKFCPQLNNNSPFPLPALTVTILLSISMNLTTIGISNKWNYIKKKKKNSGALCWLGPWTIVMTWSWNIVMTRMLEHCDDKGHGALWWHGHGTLWWQEFCSIAITRAMEHCDDTVMEHCEEWGHGEL